MCPTIVRQCPTIELNIFSITVTVTKVPIYEETNLVFFFFKNICIFSPKTFLFIFIFLTFPEVSLDRKTEEKNVIYIYVCILQQDNLSQILKPRVPDLEKIQFVNSEILGMHI